MSSFGQRVVANQEKFGQLIVGIDPHSHVLERLGLPNTARGAADFARIIFEQSLGEVGFYKPQIALFERFGTQGLVEYANVISEYRSELAKHEAILIADAKRADIGTSMTGYAEAWYGNTSDLVADALTINPYLGIATLEEPFRFAVQHGRGGFILAMNSNPESFALQQAGNPSTAAIVVQELKNVLANFSSDAPLADFGLVIGATVKLEDYGLSAEDIQGLPILMPGVGSQGARLEDIQTHFKDNLNQLLINQSRSLYGATDEEIRDNILDQAERYRQVSHT